MHRFAYNYLTAWKDGTTRKPLIIRGARQVGKSTLVALFAKEHFRQCITVNFEKKPELSALFSSCEPLQILSLLALEVGQTINPGQDLLFLDEIQAAPEVIKSLRYFYEELPALHVIAAGSLLEFALQKLTFSMPVGRIEYLYLGPMQFEEFLLALEKPLLCDFLRQYHIPNPIPEPIHHQLLGFLRSYLAIGGMPEAVARFVQENRQFAASEAAKQSILNTYQDDFHKYQTRVDPQRLRKVFQRLPFLVGKKFKYVEVDPHLRAKEIAQALEVLMMARVAYKVRHSAANGIPLGAQAVEAHFKVLFLDVGLLATLTGISALDLEKMQDAILVHSGALCEQMVGQHLLYSRSFYEEPQLYYWIREQINAAAEVDYVITEGTQVIPVEVKSGKSGTLRSLHWFLKEKRRTLALRLNMDVPSLMETTTTLSDGSLLAYKLLSLPLYLVGQVRRLCSD